MIEPQLSPEAHYAQLRADYLARGLGAPGAKKGFGSSAITADGKIFAMLVRGHLVVKLPPLRVTELIQQGIGEPFDANRGRPMKGWLTIFAGHEDAWNRLAEEALRHVSA